MTEEDYEAMADELAAIHNELLYLSLALGEWYAARRERPLQSVAAAANNIALAARRVERLAEGPAG